MKTLLMILLFVPSVGWAKEKTQKPAPQPNHNHQSLKATPGKNLKVKEMIRVKKDHCFFILLPFLDASLFCEVKGIEKIRR